MIEELTWFYGEKKSQFSDAHEKRPLTLKNTRNPPLCFGVNERRQQKVSGPAYLDFISYQFNLGFVQPSPMGRSQKSKSEAILSDYSSSFSAVEYRSKLMLGYTARGTAKISRVFLI